LGAAKGGFSKQDLEAGMGKKKKLTRKGFLKNRLLHLAGKIDLREKEELKRRALAFQRMEGGRHGWPDAFGKGFRKRKKNVDR